MKYRAYFWGYLFVALFLVFTGCATDTTPAAAPDEAPPPPEVTVAQPTVREIVEWDEYSGRLEAIDYVEVRARVSGYLDSIHFEDGEQVKKGELLFVIDPRPFQAELRQQEADLLRTEAALELAESNFRRAEKLLADKVIPQEAYDTRANTQREAEVAIEAAKARVERAKLDVEYTKVRAPVTGRISANYISEGNFISGGSAQGTLLTTLVSLDPIYCTFEVSERDFLKYARLDRSGERDRDTAHPVYLRLSDEEDYPHAGKLQFIDNQLNPGTATIRVRAVFDNPDQFLTPGLFARLRLSTRDAHEALLVPDQAISTDQSQKYVLTVDGENIVQYRPVELGPLVDGLRVVRSGISADDRVVVNGLFRAMPGAPVTPVSESTAKPTEAKPTEAKPTDVEPAATEATAPLGVD